VNHEEDLAMTDNHPPLPPFSRDSAIQKVRVAENGWNTCNPELVSHVYTPDSYWRNRSEFLRGRAEIVVFLTRKWANAMAPRFH
jgi:nuclear transport factor 2 (NTF2) superfamily protein